MDFMITLANTTYVSTSQVILSSLMGPEVAIGVFALVALYVMTRSIRGVVGDYLQTVKS